MANVKISALPEHTGVTTDGWFVFNNSGETTTSKSKIINLFYYDADNSGIVASGDSTNINILLKPKGEGAIQVDVSGDARGKNAVDFQSSRISSNQVASGEASTVFGDRNRASAAYSFVAGGQQNASSGLWSFTSGFNCFASNNQTTAMGRVTTASGEVSTAFGDGSQAGGSRSLATCYQGNAFINNSFAQGGRAESVAGDNQYFRYIQSLHNVPLDSGDTVYLSSEAFSGFAESIDIRRNNNGAIKVHADWVAVCRVSNGGGGDPIVGDMASGSISYAMKNISGTLTQLGTTTRYHEYSDASMSGATILPAIVSNELNHEFTTPNTDGVNNYKIIITIHVTQIGWQ